MRNRWPAASGLNTGVEAAIHKAETSERPPCQRSHKFAVPAFRFANALRMRPGRGPSSDAGDISRTLQLARFGAEQRRAGRVQTGCLPASLPKPRVQVQQLSFPASGSRQAAYDPGWQSMPKSPTPARLRAASRSPTSCRGPALLRRQGLASGAPVAAMLKNNPPLNAWVRIETSSA